MCLDYDRLFIINFLFIMYVAWNDFVHIFKTDRKHGHRIHRGQHSQLNKLTHPEFPKGYYLLFRYPTSWRNNEIEERLEPLDNEILTNDLVHSNSISRRSRQRLISGNRIYKRDAETDKVQLSECCDGACNHLFCN